MKHHRGDGEHGEGDGNAPRDAYMHRIREIEEAMRSGKISREEGTRAIEETKRSLEEATRDGQETSSTSPRKDDARTGMKTIGVEPRFVPEEEYNRVEADLKRLVITHIFPLADRCYHSSNSVFFIPAMQALQSELACGPALGV